MTFKNNTYRNITITSILTIILITSGIGVVYATSHIVHDNDVEITGKLGIGTDSPLDLLSIEAASSPKINVTDTTNAVSTIIKSDNNKGNIGTSSNHDLKIITNNTERIRILSTGNVGIGTSSPSDLLSIEGDTDPQISVTDTTTPVTTVLGANNNQGFVGTTTSNHMIFLTNDVEKMRLNINGNVGIGTSSPSEPLHVVGDTYVTGDSIIDGNVGIGVSNPTAPLQVIGNVTFGRNSNVANGDYSAAFGISTDASGDYSAAFGHSTDASGDYSAAFGHSTDASGYFSAAFGSSTAAIGNYSAAFGVLSTASGEYSAAFGVRTTAQPYSSFVIGKYNEISGSTNSWVATDPLFVIGNGADNSTRNNALTVLKNGNVGIGISSPTALLQVIGNVTFGSPSNGAIGDHSAAFGAATIASGHQSTTFGHFTTAQPYASFVVGRHNEISGDKFNWVSTDPLFVIGNGADSNNQANAVTVLKNGNVGIGTSSPTSLVEITSSGTILGLNVTNTGSGDSFRVNDESGDTTPFVIDSSGNVGIGTSSPNSTLQVSGYIQLDTVETPPDSDCDAANEVGRMKVALNKRALHVCTYDSTETTYDWLGIP